MEIQLSRKRQTVRGVHDYSVVNERWFALEACKNIPHSVKYVNVTLIKC